MRLIQVLLILLLLATAPAAANPYSGEVALVVIDPGHGGSDPGAIGNGVEEKDLTLSISTLLCDELEERGYETAMTREDDTYLGLQERCDLANSLPFDISGYPVFVSIHINSAEASSARGFEVYVRDSSKQSLMLSPSTSDELALKYSSYTNHQLNSYHNAVSTRLATLITEEVASSFPQIRIRGVKSNDYWVLNATWMPSVLVEVGFISNSEEAEMMASPTFQENFASALADAISSL